MYTYTRHCIYTAFLRVSSLLTFRWSLSLVFPPRWSCLCSAVRNEEHGVHRHPRTDAFRYLLEPWQILQKLMPVSLVKQPHMSSIPAPLHTKWGFVRQDLIEEGWGYCWQGHEILVKYSWYQNRPKAMAWSSILLVCELGWSRLEIK